MSKYIVLRDSVLQIPVKHQNVHYKPVYWKKIPSFRIFSHGYDVINGCGTVKSQNIAPKISKLS